MEHSRGVDDVINLDHGRVGGRDPRDGCSLELDYFAREYECRFSSEIRCKLMIAKSSGFCVYSTGAGLARPLKVQIC